MNVLSELSFKEQTASDGGDQRRRVLCLSRHWQCPLRSSPATARVSPSHRTRLRLQISRRTTSSLAPGLSIGVIVQNESSQEARSARQVVRLAYGDRSLSSVVSEYPQLPRWFSHVGSPQAPAGAVALSLRLARVQPHRARACGDPTWLGASG